MTEKRCTVCGKVPVPPDCVIAGLCEACNEAYCAAHQDDPDPEPARRYAGPVVREWTQQDWDFVKRFN
jgi:hypothetical protein